MRVLVTGGAGFIGSNLAQHLLAAEPVDEVRVLDDLSTGHRGNLDGLDVVFTEGSILDFDTVRERATGVDAIVHLAAIPSVPRSVANPRASHDANTTGTLNILEAARETGVSQVIVASSSSVYGSNPKLPKNEFDWTSPLSPYAVSKLATESYALAYQASYDLKALAFRFFNVFGPGQAAGHAYAAVIPQFLDAALRQKPVEIHGDGLQSRDFTYVGTVCSVITDAVLRQVHDKYPVNLALGTNTTLLELLDEIEAQLGQPIERTFSPPRLADVKASQADPTRLNALFPEIAPAPLAEGLAATIAWMREQLTDQKEVQG